MIFAKRRCKKLLGRMIAVRIGEQLVAYGKVVNIDDEKLHVETNRNEHGIFTTCVLYNDVVKIDNWKLYATASEGRKQDAI